MNLVPKYDMQTCSRFLTWPVREQNFHRDGGHFTEVEKESAMDRAVPGRNVPCPAEILLQRGTVTKTACWLCIQCHIIVT